MTKSTEFERHLKLGQVAEILGVSRRTVWRWIKEGKIKAVKLPSGIYVVPETEVERIIGER